MRHQSSLVTIDGAHGEGGGALLRSALALSALTQQPVRVTDVRGGTRFPGLDPEDITILRALTDSCAAECTGVAVGSSDFSFAPTRHPKGISGRIATFRNESNRGSNALVVLNTLLPVLSQSGVYCTLSSEGETYGVNTLGYDAFANSTLCALKKLGLYAYPNLLNAGYSRESRGEVQIDLEPSRVEGIQWNDRGPLVEVSGVFTTSNLSKSIATRALGHLENLARQAYVTLQTEHVEVDAETTGCHLTLWAHYDRGFGGASAMGAKAVRAEMLAQGAFDSLLDGCPPTPASILFSPTRSLFPASSPKGEAPSRCRA